ncbi:hypothetical protein PR048_007958 [Dryococelus australis]|uniref:Integrase catalytic domain-containing protein n=1 Tax=Dryococelus australis TaxID=614101 RepID=A0ABQ9HVQ6_9NEOP|nr:hypothetical protein PR048_007958 [Dryococelus australis]
MLPVVLVCGVGSAWLRLHMDFASPVQGQVFLIIVDSYSKWLEVAPVKWADSSSVIRVLRSLFDTHGLPGTLVSDNASAFSYTLIQEFVKNNGIQLVKVAPYHPSSNGQAECMVQTMKCSLKKMCSGDLSRQLTRPLLAQHDTQSAFTSSNPAELLRICLDRIHPDFSEEMKDKQEKPCS